MNTTIPRSNNTCNNTLFSSIAFKKCDQAGILNISQIWKDCYNDYQVKIF